MTTTLQAPSIEVARVFHGAEGATAFVTPLSEEGYSFRVAAGLWSAMAPTFEHREEGDLVLFPEILSPFTVRKIAEYANVGEFVHYPGRIHNFDEQLALARATLGGLRSEI